MRKFKSIEELVNHVEPIDSGVHVKTSFPFHSMMSPTEIQRALAALADAIWCFVYA